MLNIIINGAGGRMGKTIIKLMKGEQELVLTGAFDRPSHPETGKDAGEIAGIGNLGVNLTSDITESLAKSDVVIDFSSPQAIQNLLKEATAAKKAVVIGTTGHTDQEKKAFKKAANKIPLLVSPNMCIGVNLLWKLSEISANALGKDYQVNIVEKHHIHKKDAPSGTAKKLMQIVTTITGHDIDKDVFYSVDGTTISESEKPISVQSIREGEIVGDHTIYFTSKEDRIELAHCAFTRDIFGKGALTAAKWIVDKPSGLYDMQDVLFGV